MKDLQNLLCSINRDVVVFATDGFIEQIHLPRLQINNIGEISLPLCELQAQKIAGVIKRNSTDSREEM